ncbi:DUF6247 family protein [Streptomyces erythrochromogenes]|uniref:DUF6247 family protein n=1 Tax=Streptomyces erythrochromogenes TaxID=285574 RepID=UPI001FD83EA0|nr:DUF6247 family protein [Streptomyces erythrochromogenes]
MDTHLDAAGCRARLADRARQLAELLPEPGSAGRASRQAFRRVLVRGLACERGGSLCQRLRDRNREWAAALEESRRTLLLAGLYEVVQDWRGRLSRAPSVDSLVASGDDDGKFTNVAELRGRCR